MLTFQTENLSDSSPDELRLFQNITRFRKARSSWDDFENLIHELLINASASMSESRNHLKYESTSEDGYSAVLFYKMTALLELLFS